MKRFIEILDYPMLIIGLLLIILLSFASLSNLVNNTAGSLLKSQILF